MQPLQKLTDVTGSSSLILGVAALAGGAYWYLQNDPAAKAQLEHDVNKVKNKVDGKLDDLKADRRTLGEKAHDTATSQRNLGGSKADPYIGSALAKGAELKEDAKAEAKGWFGRSESAADAASRKVEEEKYYAQRKAGEVKDEVSERLRVRMTNTSLTSISATRTGQVSLQPGSQQGRGGQGCRRTKGSRG